MRSWKSADEIAEANHVILKIINRCSVATSGYTWKIF
jgi:hypothetical protein